MIYRTSILMAIAMIVSIAAFVAPHSAHAQRLCPSITVVNTTGCDLNFLVYDRTGMVATFHIPPGNTIVTAPPGFGAPIGVITTAGTSVAFRNNCALCASILGFGGGPSCCASACFDSGTCTLRLAPCSINCIP